MQKVIEVTKSHIDNGNQEEHDSCPVALALQDAGFNQVSVTNLGIETTDGEFYCSRSVERFISKFDKQGKRAVKPFRFKLKPIK